MKHNFVDEEENKEMYNPYNLFLILILLILSNDILQMLKSRNLKQKNISNRKSITTNRKGLKILAKPEKDEVERIKWEPKESRKED